MKCNLRRGVHKPDVNCESERVVLPSEVAIIHIYWRLDFSRASRWVVRKHIILFAIQNNVITVEGHRYSFLPELPFLTIALILRVNCRRVAFEKSSRNRSILIQQPLCCCEGNYFFRCNRTTGRASCYGYKVG